MKLILTFLGILFLNSNVALSEYHSCERTSLETKGFTNKSAAESWYPRRISITTNLEKKTATMMDKEVDLWVRDDKRRMRATFPRRMSEGFNIIHKVFFLPNGEVHSEMSSPGGFQRTGGAVYKCTNWEKK
jgi:hypothetical protein